MRSCHWQAGRAAAYSVACCKVADWDQSLSTLCQCFDCCAGHVETCAAMIDGAGLRRQQQSLELPMLVPLYRAARVAQYMTSARPIAGARNARVHRPKLIWLWPQGQHSSRLSALSKFTSSRAIHQRCRQLDVMPQLVMSSSSSSYLMANPEL